MGFSALARKPSLSRRILPQLSVHDWGRLARKAEAAEALWLEAFGATGARRRGLRSACYNAEFFLFMAILHPFRALRYDPSRVQPQLAVTQPYDKITPAMQEQYYAASPYNLVRIILGKAEAGDGEGSNVYTRAAQSFADWRMTGVLKPDAEPCFYTYTQSFTVPGIDCGGAN